MFMLGPESAILTLFVMLPWLAFRLLGRIPIRRAILEALFAGYVLALFGVVFLPLRPVAPDAVRYLSASISLLPTHTIIGILQDFHGQVIRQLVGNIVLFVPLGFLLPALSASRRRLGATVVTAIMASVGIEMIQLAMLLTMTSQRAVDVDDVILNVTGAVLGHLVWQGIRALGRRRVARPDIAAGVRAEQLPAEG